MSLAAAVAVLVAVSPLAGNEPAPPRSSGVSVTATAIVTILRAGRTDEGNSTEAVYRSARVRGGALIVSFE